jgi:hypothetical protein
LQPIELELIHNPEGRILTMVRFTSLVMNTTGSAYRGHVPNEVMYVEVTDLEAGPPPPLVGDSYGHPFQKFLFQEERSEDLSGAQICFVTVWLLVASAMNVIMFDKSGAFPNAKIEAMFFFITADFIFLGALLEKYFGNNKRAFFLLWLSSLVFGISRLCCFWS